MSPLRESFAQSAVVGLSLFASAAMAGTTVMTTSSAADPGGFESAIRPITNPTLFDSALPVTDVHPIMMFQRLPDFVNTTIGPVPLGGNAEVYAVQFEYALNQRLSIVATKDGYVDFNPDSRPLWSNQGGFANIGAGLKYAFVYNPARQFALSGTATFEFPTGNHDVFQGEGDGVVNLIVSALKLFGPWELAGGAGLRLPIDGQMATTSFMSGHVSYEVNKYFIPLIEMNWHHVLDNGNGHMNFFSQAGGAVPAVATFEGGDLLNLGAVNANQNRDFVTAAIGFRSRISPSVDLGFAYELPLSEDNSSLMKDRYTLDLVWRF